MSVKLSEIASAVADSVTKGLDGACAHVCIVVTHKASHAPACDCGACGYETMIGGAFSCGKSSPESIVANTASFELQARKMVHTTVELAMDRGISAEQVIAVSAASAAQFHAAASSMLDIKGGRGG